MTDSLDNSRSHSIQAQRVWLYLLLGFAGGGIGALLALYVGVTSWPDARLFVLSGVAIGLGLASLLAPSLLKEKHREASPPKL
jgi:H+/Cl- antiporter ClcA